MDHQHHPAPVSEAEIPATSDAGVQHPPGFELEALVREHVKTLGTLERIEQLLDAEQTPPRPLVLEITQATPAPWSRPPAAAAAAAARDPIITISAAAWGGAGATAAATIARGAGQEAHAAKLEAQGRRLVVVRDERNHGWLITDEELDELR